MIYEGRVTLHIYDFMPLSFVTTIVTIVMVQMISTLQPKPKSLRTFTLIGFTREIIEWTSLASKWIDKKDKKDKNDTSRTFI